MYRVTDILLLVTSSRPFCRWRLSHPGEWFSRRGSAKPLRSAWASMGPRQIFETPRKLGHVYLHCFVSSHGSSFKRDDITVSAAFLSFCFPWSELSSVGAVTQVDRIRAQMPPVSDERIKESSESGKESYEIQEIEAVPIEVASPESHKFEDVTKIPSPPPLSPNQRKRLYRKIDLRLLPILILIQVCSYLDRGMLCCNSHRVD